MWDWYWRRMLHLYRHWRNGRCRWNRPLSRWLCGTWNGRQTARTRSSWPSIGQRLLRGSTPLWLTRSEVIRSCGCNTPEKYTAVENTVLGLNIWISMYSNSQWPCWLEMMVRQPNTSGRDQVGEGCCTVGPQNLAFYRSQPPPPFFCF